MVNQSHLAEMIHLTHSPFTTGRYAAMREVPLFAGVLYYGITSMLKRPTVGEEYCDIVPVTKAAMKTFGRERKRRSLCSKPLTSPSLSQLHGNAPASNQRRLGFLAFHLGAPYLLKVCLDRMRRGETSEALHYRYPRVSTVNESTSVEN